MESPKAMIEDPSESTSSCMVAQTKWPTENDIATTFVSEACSKMPVTEDTTMLADIWPEFISGLTQALSVYCNDMLRSVMA